MNIQNMRPGTVHRIVNLVGAETAEELSGPINCAQKSFVSRAAKAGTPKFKPQDIHGRTAQLLSDLREDTLSLRSRPDARKVQKRPIA